MLIQVRHAHCFELLRVSVTHEIDVLVHLIKGATDSSGYGNSLKVVNGSKQQQ
jgi:hypothetical protein